MHENSHRHFDLCWGSDMLHIGIANAKLKVMLATLGQMEVLSYHRTLSPALHFMRFFFWPNTLVQKCMHALVLVHLTQDDEIFYTVCKNISSCVIHMCNTHWKILILKCHCKLTHRLCLRFSRCIWYVDLIKCHAYLFCRSVVFTVFLERESGCEFRWRGGQTTSAAAANPAAADADQLAASLTWSWHQIWVLGKTFTPHWFVLDVWVWWQNICVYICRPYKQNRPSQDCVFGSAPRYCISD